VKIRLRRTGAKKNPSYRVVVADSKSPRNGKIIAQIGHYNPMNHPAVINIDAEAAKYWLSKGAQPTDSVKILFTKINLN
jgi:ribosomal protein S16